MLSPASLLWIERLIADNLHKGLEPVRKAIKQLPADNEVRGFFVPENRPAFNDRTLRLYRALSSGAFQRFLHNQLTEAGFPIWIFRSFDGCACRTWDQLVLPANHPAWQVIFPPNCWLCEARVVGARSERGARRIGGNPEKPIPPAFDTPEGIAAIAHSLPQPLRSASGPVLADLIRAIEDEPETQRFL